MYPRTNYEMTEEDLQVLIKAARPTVAIMVGGTTGSSPQENSNRAWEALGTKMGFDHMTVKPISGKGTRFFTAVPSETEQQRVDRTVKDANDKIAAEITQLTEEITERQDRIKELTT